VESISLVSLCQCTLIYSMLFSLSMKAFCLSSLLYAYTSFLWINNHQNYELKPWAYQIMPNCKHGPLNKRVRSIYPACSLFVLAQSYYRKRKCGEGEKAQTHRRPYLQLVRPAVVADAVSSKSERRRPPAAHGLTSLQIWWSSRRSGWRRLGASTGAGIGRGACELHGVVVELADDREARKHIRLGSGEGGEGGRGEAGGGSS
jgi:hypothetical protein